MKPIRPPTKSKQLNDDLKKQGVILAYLFGSQVHGMTHQESDVDIGVVLDKRISPRKYFDKSLKLPNVFQKIYPGQERVVTILNQAPLLLRHQVISGGKLLYSRSQDDWVKFHLSTVHDYEDTKYLRKMKWLDLQERVKAEDY